MLELINELLDLARLDLGAGIDLQREPTDLLTLVERCLADQPGTNGRAIHLEAASPVFHANIDAARITRMVGNLLSNALKYSPAGSTIWVRLAREEGTTGPEAVIAVRDAGIGVPAADLPHIFDRFHRARNVVGHIQGTGIGLASARGIVEQHGGTITVESVEGAGATFTIYLHLQM
jgi:signal transduction histidine kinase